MREGLGLPSASTSCTNWKLSRKPCILEEKEPIKCRAGQVLDTDPVARKGGQGWYGMEGGQGSLMRRAWGEDTRTCESGGVFGGVI